MCARGHAARRSAFLTLWVTLSRRQNFNLLIRFGTLRSGQLPLLGLSKRSRKRLPAGQILK